jgi:WD40 repeat protein
MRWALRILAAFLVLAAGMSQAQAPAAKLALVVGVSDYGRERAAQETAGFVVPPPLANAVRDADLMASALEAKGFIVTRVTNPDKRALLSSVTTFAAALGRAGPDAVGLFYFAGHGAQGRPALERDIDNYLIPLGADLATEVDLDSEALALSRISAALRPAPQGAVVLILDACRDFALPAASRGMVTRGLAEARAAPGTIIAYATSPGAAALDNLPGQSNGPYATALAAEIRAARGTRLEDVFIGTRNRVLAATRNTQTPWENGSLRRVVTIGVVPSPISVSAPQPPPRLVTTLASRESQWLSAQSPRAIFGTPTSQSSASKVRWSPDGNRIVTAQANNRSDVWDLQLRRIVFTLEHDGAVNDVAWSPNGKLIATASSDYRVRIWDALSGNLVRTLRGHDWHVSSVVFSPDSRLLLSTSDDKTARLWSVESGRTVRTFRDDGELWSGAFSADGTRIAAGGINGLVRVWSLESGQQLSAFRVTSEGRGGTNSVSFSPDGDRILTGNNSGLALVWTLETGQPTVANWSTASIREASFSRDGNLILLAGVDGAARVVRQVAGKTESVVAIRHEKVVFGAAFSPDGRSIATASEDGGIRVWQPN